MFLLLLGSCAASFQQHTEVLQPFHRHYSVFTGRRRSLIFHESFGPPQETSKTGGCVLDIGTGTVPAAGPRVVSAPTTDSHIAPFSEHMNVYGLQLLADANGQQISSNFLCFVAKIVVEMYPQTVPNLSDQTTLLENMYK